MTSGAATPARPGACTWRPQTRGDSRESRPAHGARAPSPPRGQIGPNPNWGLGTGRRANRRAAPDTSRAALAAAAAAATSAERKTKTRKGLDDLSDLIDLCRVVLSDPSFVSRLVRLLVSFVVREGGDKLVGKRQAVADAKA